MLHRTPLYDTHVAASAKLVPFGGWEMPLHYGSIIAEHHAVRRQAGVFDVSHMGRLTVEGPDAETFLRGVLTRDVAKLAANRSGYTLLCNEGGGVIDDAIVTRLAGGGYFVVVNASNRPAVLSWLASQRGERAVTVTDHTTARAMVAVQGPTAGEVAGRLLGHDLSAQRYYSLSTAAYGGAEVMVFRSGYTGEDGFEAVLPAELAPRFWADVVGTGLAVPAGLGARDTLRLEAGMPLYGHEYTPTTDGLSAGAGWVIDLAGDRAFVGSASLRAIAAAGPARRLVGLRLTGRRQARQGATIHPPATPQVTIGEVTSGALSPTLEAVIAMGYVAAGQAAVGTELLVAAGGGHIAATVVGLPFYKRARS